MKTEMKLVIVQAIKENRAMYNHDAVHARSLGLSPAVYSQIVAGKVDGKVSNARWAQIARKLDVDLNCSIPWRAVETPVYTYVTEQLTTCQKQSIAGILCDIADVGKTFTAKRYARTHSNCVYLDCSFCKTRAQFLTELAKAWGITGSGSLTSTVKDLVYYLVSLEKPLVILDEVGDLSYEAFLEIKALWNATEKSCGWYMMGADGLKAKIEKAIDHKKVGYTEIFSRFGKKFSKAVPLAKKDQDNFLMAQAAMVAKANLPQGTDVDLMTLVHKADGSLRRVFVEIQKLVTDTISVPVNNG